MSCFEEVFTWNQVGYQLQLAQVPALRDHVPVVADFRLPWRCSTSASPDRAWCDHMNFCRWDLNIIHEKAQGQHCITELFTAVDNWIETNNIEGELQDHLTRQDVDGAWELVNTGIENLAAAWRYRSTAYKYPPSEHTVALRAQKKDVRDRWFNAWECLQIRRQPSDPIFFLNRVFQTGFFQMQLRKIDKQIGAARCRDKRFWLQYWHKEYNSARRRGDFRQCWYLARKILELILDQEEDSMVPFLLFQGLPNGAIICRRMEEMAVAVPLSLLRAMQTILKNILCNMQSATCLF